MKTTKNSYVAHTACVWCSKGSAVTRLRLSDRTLYGTNRIATKIDTLKQCFEGTFGVCKRTNKPCTMGLDKLWIDSSRTSRNGILRPFVAEYQKQLQKCLQAANDSLSWFTKRGFHSGDESKSLRGAIRPVGTTQTNEMRSAIYDARLALQGARRYSNGMKKAGKGIDTSKLKQTQKELSKLSHVMSLYESELKLQQAAAVQIITMEANLPCIDQGGYVYPISSGQNHNPQTGKATVSFDEGIHVLIVKKESLNLYPDGLLISIMGYDDETAVNNCVAASIPDLLDNSHLIRFNAHKYKYEFGVIARMFLPFVFQDAEGNNLSTTRELIYDDEEKKRQAVTGSFNNYYLTKIDQLDKDVIEKANTTMREWNSADATKKKMDDLLTGEKIVDAYIKSNLTFQNANEEHSGLVENNDVFIFYYQSPNELGSTQQRLSLFNERKIEYAQLKEKYDLQMAKKDELYAEFDASYNAKSSLSGSKELYEYSGQKNSDEKLLVLLDQMECAQKLTYMLTKGAEAAKQYAKDIIDSCLPVENANHQPGIYGPPTKWMDISNYGLWGQWYETGNGWHTGIDVCPGAGGDVCAIHAGHVIYQTGYYIMIYNKTINKTLCYMHLTVTLTGVVYPTDTFNAVPDDAVTSEEFTRITQWKKIGVEAANQAGGRFHTHFAVHEGVYSPHWFPTVKIKKKGDINYLNEQLEMNAGRELDHGIEGTDSNYGQSYTIEEKTCDGQTNQHEFEAVFRQVMFYDYNDTNSGNVASTPMEFSVTGTTNVALFSGTVANVGKDAYLVSDSFTFTGNQATGAINYSVEDGALYTIAKKDGDQYDAKTAKTVLARVNVLTNPDGSLFKYENPWFRGNGRIRPKAELDDSSLENFSTLEEYVKLRKPKDISLNDVAPGKNMSINPYPTIRAAWSDLSSYSDQAELLAAIEADG